MHSSLFPDQDAAVLIHCEALALDEFGFQIFQIGVIELELPLEGAVGQAPAAPEHGYRLVEDSLKGHCPPSLGRYGMQQTVWEEEKPCGRTYTAHREQKKAGSTGGVVHREHTTRTDVRGIWHVHVARLPPLRPSPHPGGYHVPTQTGSDIHVMLTKARTKKAQ